MCGVDAQKLSLPGTDRFRITGIRAKLKARPLLRAFKRSSCLQQAGSLSFAEHSVDRDDPAMGALTVPSKNFRVDAK